MKTIASIAAVALAATAAHAQQAQTPKVPTGYQVQGKTEYIMPPGTYRVTQVDCEKPETFFDRKFSTACRGRSADGLGNPNAPAAK